MLYMCLLSRPLAPSPSTEQRNLHVPLIHIEPLFLPCIASVHESNTTTKKSPNSQISPIHTPSLTMR